MSKKIAIATPDDIVDAEIEPGTTTTDILKFLGLSNESMLSPKNGLPFAKDEMIYGQVAEGEKLILMPKAEVASLKRTTA